MALDLDQLPDDPAFLREALRDLVGSFERQRADLEATKAELDEARVGLGGRDAEIERLRQLIRRLMRQHGLQPRLRRRFVRTTDSAHDQPIFPDRTKELHVAGPTNSGSPT